MRVSVNIIPIVVPYRYEYESIWSLVFTFKGDCEYTVSVEVTILLGL
jgi:hypothetical protein